MPILVVALSGRALAAAARRAGAEVIVADLYGDTDTRALAPWHRLPGSLGHGIDSSAAAALARELPPVDGIVCGAGFEAAPNLLSDLAQIAPLIGNTPETIAAVKDPFGFAATLRRLGLPHPAVAARPESNGVWLRKRVGGAGGTHIRRASDGDAAEPDSYYQAKAPGTPFSALFVADGHTARVVGCSVQWTDPTPEQPFRYGGCVGPIDLAPRRARWIDDACAAIAAAFGLVGLNSLDMLIEGDEIAILEVNPRPGATLDIHEDGPPWLWDLHCRGISGDLPPARALGTRQPRAATILYADRPREIPPGLEWAPSIADISAPGSRFAAGDPICTVLSAGPDLAGARAQGRHRAEAVLRRLPELLPKTA